MGRDNLSSFRRAQIGDDDGTSRWLRALLLAELRTYNDAASCMVFVVATLIVGKR
jgi:hypothetical protein